MILVAGAGPVGMTLAMSLRRLGAEVRVIDPAPSRTDKSKALVIWPRTLELLAIQGCTGPFIAAGMRGRGARMIAEGEELVHVDFGKARSVYRFALMIPQSETERVLEEELAQLGVAVERQLALAAFRQDDGGVEALLRAADGSERLVRADYLAGCDGAHSTVRHGLDARFTGSTLPSLWVLGDVVVDGPLPADELSICWSADGVLALFPIPGGRVRVIANVDAAAADAKATPTLADLQDLLAARGPRGLTARDPVWLSHFTINERKVEDYRYGRVFLAGDAAHIHSPAGGQGMNTGMQDAINLSWKLALVTSGRARPSLLDTYSLERSAIGEQVLRNAGRLTEVAIVRNPLLQELRNLAARTLGQLASVQQRIVDQLTEVDLHYADSPLTNSPPSASRRPAGGERAVDTAVTATDGAATSLYSLLGSGRFALLSVGASLVEVPPGMRTLVTSAAAATAEHYDSGHVYLVRPDAYVAMSTTRSEAGAILAELARLTP